MKIIKGLVMKKQDNKELSKAQLYAKDNELKIMNNNNNNKVKIMKRIEITKNHNKEGEKKEIEYYSTRYGTFFYVQTIEKDSNGKLAYSWYYCDLYGRQIHSQQYVEKKKFACKISDFTRRKINDLLPNL